MAFTITACGESTSSKAVATPAADGQAFTARLNAVCDLDNQQQDAVGLPPRINRSDPTAQDLRAATAYLDKQLPVLHTVITGLGQLGEPPQNQQAFDGALAAEEAAKTGDSNSFKSGLAGYQSDVARAESLIHTLGTTHCAPDHSNSTGGSSSSSSASPSTTS
jgi:hypothetical protein